MSKFIFGVSVLFGGLAIGSHLFAFSVSTFIFSAITLICISKILGDATEQLSLHVGQNTAGLVNVTLSNLAELIIIFVAVRSNLIELVQGGIVGSIIGNLLLVMGCSIYFGCRKHKKLKFNTDTADLFINQLFLVAVALFLPTLFSDKIPENNQQMLTNILALMLFGAYVYHYLISATDERFNPIEEQVHKIKKTLSFSLSLVILMGTAIGAFFMSELLVGEVEHIGNYAGVSQTFIGFIVLPLLGNIAEHAVAVVAATKKMTELSLAIAVGSASQVGMVVAPCAVLFGILTGNQITFNFGALPLDLLAITFIAAFLVLRDGEWYVNEGVMLIQLYLAIVLVLIFTKPF